MAHSSVTPPRDAGKPTEESPGAGKGTKGNHVPAVTTGKTGSNKNPVR